MEAIMERMVGFQGRARLQAAAKQQTMLDNLQRSLKEQIQVCSLGGPTHCKPTQASLRLAAHLC